MTEYLKPSFSVSLGSDAYQAGWERIFGKVKCRECDGVGRILSCGVQKDCRECEGTGTGKRL